MSNEGLQKGVVCSDHEQVWRQVRGPRPPDHPQPQLQGGHPQRGHRSLQVCLGMGIKRKKYSI